MTRQLQRSGKSVFLACLLLILFSSFPCAAREPVPGLRLLISPGAFTGRHMDISFNGRSDRPAFEHLSGSLTDGPAAGFPMDFPECIFLRFGPGMLKYVNFGISSDQDALPSLPAGSDGIEGRPSEKVSFEIQTGLSDLSGALFIVLQL